MLNKDKVEKNMQLIIFWKVGGGAAQICWSEEINPHFYPKYRGKYQKFGQLFWKVQSNFQM